MTALQTSSLGCVEHLELENLAIDTARVVGESEAVIWITTQSTLVLNTFQLSVLAARPAADCRIICTPGEHFELSRSAASRMWRTY
uniref:B229_F1_33 n=1 Tax=Mycobacterium leprae TaxID=1769 RepID=Q49875_MYCLR|nr:B229_F1_33 [Mycobacterium leprae]